MGCGVPTLEHPTVASPTTPQEPGKVHNGINWSGGSGLDIGTD